MIKDLDRHKTINEMHEKLNGVRSKWATKYGIIIDKPPQLTIVAVVEINKFKSCRNIAQFSLFLIHLTIFFFRILERSTDRQSAACFMLFW